MQYNTVPVRPTHTNRYSNIRTVYEVTLTCDAEGWGVYRLMRTFIGYLSGEEWHMDRQEGRYQVHQEEKGHLSHISFQFRE